MCFDAAGGHDEAATLASNGSPPITRTTFPTCQKHHDHFGVDGGDILVVQGPSKTFNPLLDDGVIAELPPVHNVFYQAYTTRRAALVATPTRWRSATRRVSMLSSTSYVPLLASSTRCRRRTSQEDRTGKVIGDAYGAEWVAGAWARCGVRLRSFRVAQERNLPRGHPSTPTHREVGAIVPAALRVINRVTAAAVRVPLKPTRRY
jgi:hypothetical protein